MYRNIASRFGEAGLELRLADRPLTLGRGMAEIFQMDIRRASSHDARSEYFLAWPGEDPSSAMVLAADRRQRQVVLSVRERERVFEESVPEHMVRRAKSDSEHAWRLRLAERFGVAPHLVVTRDGTTYLKRVTPGSTRHLLAGRDERQLFMCQLREPVTSVRQAHDSLRAPEAKKSRSALTRPVRQGEWFFLVVPDEEIRALEIAIKGNKTVVRRKASINSYIPRAGKPHIADEIVASARSLGDVRVYVRGAIRHPDHHTLRISQWRRVVRNREAEIARSPLGGTWID
jgi:hypothetical protein